MYANGDIPIIEIVRGLTGLVIFRNLRVNPLINAITDTLESINGIYMDESREDEEDFEDLKSAFDDDDFDEVENFDPDDDFDELGGIDDTADAGLLDQFMDVIYDYEDDKISSEELLINMGFVNVATIIYEQGTDLKEAVLDLISKDDNFYIRQYALGKNIDKAISAWLDRELEILNAAVECFAWYAQREQKVGVIPVITCSNKNLKQEYHRILEGAAKNGIGLFSKYHMFTVSDTEELIPVKYPDMQRLSDLYGYEDEKEKLIKNTLALMRGIPANNILLYGDAGTGKSSLVKAIANEYKDEGLRLIQVDKDMLHHIPSIVELLSGEPLKFILFIDDLSFATNDKDFVALKTVLEGSVAARSRNVVVYATSNRRHLVKENYKDRLGDDMHRNDTLEEIASLSARFGIVITFGKPDKNLYTTLVSQMSKKYALDMPEEELHQKAEAYALRAGGRSPRVARQFVEYEIAMREVLP